mmetsp:Transcript_2422/g.5178  ORF Transcript_2422/g.5178 Transcript_2422/m.5178 type:complete len:312 (+) Transcript_2422:103-1038(+)
MECLSSSQSACGLVHDLLACCSNGAIVLGRLQRIVKVVPCLHLCLERPLQLAWPRVRFHEGHRLCNSGCSHHCEVDSVLRLSTCDEAQGLERKPHVSSCVLDGDTEAASERIHQLLGGLEVWRANLGVLREKQDSLVVANHLTYAGGLHCLKCESLLVVAHNEAWLVDIAQLWPRLVEGGEDVRLILSATNPRWSKGPDLEQVLHKDTVGATSDVDALNRILLWICFIVLGHHLSLCGDSLWQATEEDHFVSSKLLVRGRHLHVGNEELLVVGLPVRLVAESAGDHAHLNLLALPVLARRSPQVSLEVLRH